MIITIDGPIATGKSTIAKKLARAVGFIYFDTGAMYRSITWGMLKHGVDLNNIEEVKAYLDKFDFDIKIKQGERHYYVDGENVTDMIRGEKATAAVSRVSAMKEVREKLMALQREVSVGVNAVFEGRDMGTVVFPEAEIKVFLTGNPEKRAKRRYDELKAKYPEEFKDLTIEKMLEEINKRDHEDTTREIAPLRQADDALVIDTTELTIDEIILKIQEFKDTRRTRLKKT